MLFANLLGVFDERDPSKRATAVEDTYAEDVIWFEPDGVIHGRTALNARASELQTQSPGFHFSADGIMSVSQNMGVLRFCFPAGGHQAHFDATNWTKQTFHRSLSSSNTKSRKARWQA
jgi:hypothetical protein